MGPERSTRKGQQSAERLSLRIAVADDEPEMREWFEEMLTDLGHEVVAVAENGRQLLDACLEQSPDLVITDIKMPEMDGLEVSETLRGRQPTPIILVSAFHDPDLIDRALRDHVLAYLVKPIKQADLNTAIRLAARRFREFQALEQQAQDLQQALEDRKLVERAKGILMKRADLSEEDAFRRLQTLSREKNQKMVEIAHMIVTAEEAMS
jgi:response regulator NasT